MPHFLDGNNASKKYAVWGSQGLIACSGVLYGTVTVGGTFFCQLGFSLYEISLYPLILASLMFLPVLVWGKKYAIRREMLPFFITYGLIGALAQLSQFGGIVLGLPVATVSLLLYTQPIWTSLFGKLLLKERITLRKQLAIIFSICGALTLIQRETAIGGDIRGIAIAATGGVFLALWVIWGRKSGLHSQHYITTTIGWIGFSSAWLLVLWPLFFAGTNNRVMSRLSLKFTFGYWLLLVAFALIGFVLPSLSFFRGIQKVSASSAGIILLVEPVSASLMATLLFHQPIGLRIVLGGFLILLSNLLLLGDTGPSAGDH